MYNVFVGTTDDEHLLEHLTEREIVFTTSDGDVYIKKADYTPDFRDIMESIYPSDYDI